MNDALSSDSLFDLIGVGSPIVDLLARVEAAHLSTVGGAVGGMELVAPERLDALIASLPTPAVRAPGGSAGNTAVCAARLGLRTTFLGKIGPDLTGGFYQQSFVHAGGNDERFKVGTVPTGRCLSLVTPDGQRTMRTDLGAALTLQPSEISPLDFAGCRLAHIEGYLLFNRALLLAVCDAARAACCKLSLSMASFEVVRAAADLLPSLLERVDLVFANDDEAAAFSGSNDPQVGLARLLEHVPVAAVTCGKAGAWVGQRGQAPVHIPVEPVSHVIDTTGAGDAWAAGFLAGWLRGADLTTCGKLGAIMGAAVVQTLGAALNEAQWAAVKTQVAPLLRS